MDDPSGIVGDPISGMNPGVPSEKSSGILVDDRAGKNPTDKIGASSDDSGGMPQNRDILKELASINQQSRDQNVYKKTTTWQQQPGGTQVSDQTDPLEQIIRRLDRIEETLDRLGKMLKA